VLRSFNPGSNRGTQFHLDHPVHCHPQADAVEAAFSKFGNRHEVVTEGGHHEKELPTAAAIEGQVSITAA